MHYKTAIPPTYFKINDFTYPFQEIVNTYGVPNYKEINPAVFACVTFPFLFGIMFGDLGHGFLLFLISAMLCLGSSCLEQFPTFKSILPYRYILLLMGLFASFSGLIYNDFVSIPVELFDSCYYDHYYNKTVAVNHPIVANTTAVNGTTLAHSNHSLTNGSTTNTSHSNLTHSNSSTHKVNHTVPAKTNTTH